MRAPKPFDSTPFHPSLCVVEVPSGRWFGTAFSIHPRVLATAAHNLKKRGKPDGKPWDWVWVRAYDPTTKDWTDRREVDVDPRLIAPQYDAALLRVSGLQLTPLVLSADWDRGDEIMLVGFQPASTRASGYDLRFMTCAIPWSFPAPPLRPSDPEPTLYLGWIGSTRGEEAMGRGMSGSPCLRMVGGIVSGAIALQKGFIGLDSANLRPAEIMATALSWLKADLFDKLPRSERPRLVRGSLGQARPRPPAAVKELIRKVRGDEQLGQLSAGVRTEVLRHRARNFEEYCAARVARWTGEKHALDRRFVRLTLLAERNEQGRLREEETFDDLQALIDKVSSPAHPALVLLGPPGAGKTTLLCHLELTFARQGLSAHGRRRGPITLWAPLKRWGVGGGAPPEPEEWLAAQWDAARAADAPTLPAFAEMREQNAIYLLLDGLNEIPHAGESDYGARVGLWQALIERSAERYPLIRLVFTCRSLDYSAPLSGEVAVPRVQVQPLSPEQIRELIERKGGDRADAIWHALDGSKHLEFYRSPFWLEKLIAYARDGGDPSAGHAELLSGFIRQALEREGANPLFTVISRAERAAMAGAAGGTCWLPGHAPFPGLERLAWDLHRRFGADNWGSENLDPAARLMNDRSAVECVGMGAALGVLEVTVGPGDDQPLVQFDHQLWQEYFAARGLSKEKELGVARVPWRASEVQPSLDETRKELGDFEALPALKGSGWEETVLLAAPMARDPAAFIKRVAVVDLPLAGRSAARPDVRITEEERQELGRRLLDRMRDGKADLRARIAAGEALGELGTLEVLGYERGTGPDGDYWLPPFVPVPAGTYPIGTNEYSIHQNDYGPAHEVPLKAFAVAAYPVTNAEWRCFIEGGGYESLRWWQPEAKGDGILELYDRVRERWAPPLGDARFNNPLQPMVQVTWYEARAYARWLSAQTGLLIRLPSEVETEAASRGREGRTYAWGNRFDSMRANTWETRIGRTTPVGLYEGAKTPEGVYDLTGNAWEWTSSRYQLYPYRRDDGREDLGGGDARVLRGGSWDDLQENARCACRSNDLPVDRSVDDGFRLACSSPTLKR